MELLIKTRQGVDVKDTSDNKTLNFLYGNVFGRVLLKCLYRHTTAKIVGAYMNSRFSKKRIKKFISENSIDMSVYEEKEYKCYNEFFTRKIKKECMHICNDDDALIAPCDSKLSAYKIEKESIFFIKGIPYSVVSLLKNEDLAREFDGGTCLVFRLSVDNYHRYCYFDDGTKNGNIYIKGILHTVNPISLEKYNFFRENSREYTVMETAHFGKSVMMEIGAMCIGKISNLHGEYTYKRGEEKGMFEFGGSTIVVLLKQNAAVIDEDIVKNTENGIETVVGIGERIGTSVR